MKKVSKSEILNSDFKEFKSILDRCGCENSASAITILKIIKYISAAVFIAVVVYLWYFFDLEHILMDIFQQQFGEKIGLIILLPIDALLVIIVFAIYIFFFDYLPKLIFVRLNYNSNK